MSLDKAGLLDLAVDVWVHRAEVRIHVPNIGDLDTDTFDFHDKY